MNTIAIPVEEWNNIMNFNYSWVFSAIKEEMKRGIKYKLIGWDEPNLLEIDKNDNIIISKQ